MEVEVARAELLAAVRRDGDFVLQNPVAVLKDLQGAGILRLGGRALIAARHQHRQLVVGGRADLMGENAGIDRAGLLHLFARAEILVDAVHPHRARIIERDEDVLRRNVGAHVDGPGRQLYRLAMLRESTGLRIDRERGDVVLGPLPAITGLAVAARDIEIAPRCMRPGILHARRQRHRVALDQLRLGDINVVMRQIGADIRIQRHLLRRGLLRGSQARGRDAAGDQRQKRPPADHGFPPMLSPRAPLRF